VRGLRCGLYLRDGPSFDLRTISLAYIGTDSVLLLYGEFVMLVGMGVVLTAEIGWRDGLAGLRHLPITVDPFM
jgi:hypothetical protein